MHLSPFGWSLPVLGLFHVVACSAADAPTPAPEPAASVTTTATTAGAQAPTPVGTVGKPDGDRNVSNDPPPVDGGARSAAALGAPAPAGVVAASAAVGTGSTASAAGAAASAVVSANAAVAGVPTAAPTAAALDETVSAKDTGGEYAAWMQGQKSYKVGQAASVQAVAIAKGDFHANEAYPHKVKLNAAPAGVSYPDMIARSVTRTEKRVSVSVPFTATTTGPKTISGTFLFSVCNETQCKMAKSPLSITVNVE
ncbi:MAG: hypothetical protein EXR75_03540 [Myxococcales bacterium]|nr:hypothetical protein [Myxococcales bacterium]